MSPPTNLADLLEQAFPMGGCPEPTGAGERLRSCLAALNRTRRARIREEVDELLGRGLCDMQLSELIAFELGCHLRPAEMGLTPTEWLAWVGDQTAAL